MIWSVAVPSGKLLYVSPDVVTVFRRSAQEFYESRIPWSDPIHPDDRSRVVTAWNKAMQSGRLDSEHRIVLANKAVRWIHTRGRCPSSADGKIRRIDGITEDVTERRQKQQKNARLSRILVKTVRRFVAGKCQIGLPIADLSSPSPAGSARQLSHEQLSDRELQILLLIGSGRSVKQMAGDLSISVNTVHTYRTRILKKMNMRTNAALIRYAVEHGLVE